jgi:hypothetical protein
VRGRGRPKGDRTPTRGFALPAAVFAMVVVGVLVTGGFYLARQETRIGVASKRGTTAFYLAERGAMEVLSEWDAGTFGALPQWGNAALTGAADEGTWSVDVTRMTSRLFFLQSTGTVTDGEDVLGQASRRVGYVARLTSLEFNPRAALTTVGDLKVGGSSEIDGNDAIPSGWGAYCGPLTEARPGILIDDLNNISYAGGAYSVDGDPPLEEDSGLTSDVLLELGDMTWDDLVALSNITFSGGTTITQTNPDSVLVNGSWRCDTASNMNWGNPLSPAGMCGTHFPIIYSTGNLDIASSAAGQGILLVEGDLMVQGGFRFYGPVIVRGELQTAGTGGHFNGGVIAANVNLDSSTVLGNALVQYSACSVTRAILNNANLTRVRPLERRSWVDISSVTGG